MIKAIYIANSDLFYKVNIWISVFKMLNYSNSGLLFVENFYIFHDKNIIYHSPSTSFEIRNLKWSHCELSTVQTTSTQRRTERRHCGSILIRVQRFFSDPLKFIIKKPRRRRLIIW